MRRQRGLPAAGTHQSDILALERNHLLRRVSASRRVRGIACRDQSARSLEPLAFCSYLIKFDTPHRMLERFRFQGVAINDRLALDVFVDALADGFFALSGCRS